MTQYSHDIKINAKWGDYITKTLKYKYNWCEGAFRSGKSCFNAMAFAMYLDDTEDQLHLVIAATSASAKAIVEDGNGFGLRYIFGNRYQDHKKYKGLDAGFIQTKHGTKIVVYCGGDTKSSYFAFRGWSIGGICMEELNLLHENTITEAKGRILMAKNPKIFISHNPVIETHPIYKWLNELQERHLVNYIHTTLEDNPALTEERRKEIIAEFDPDSIFYKAYILGQRVNPNGSAFTVRDYNIISKYNPADYLEYIIVADMGETRSASVFTLQALAYDTTKMQYRLDILKEYYYLNNAHGEYSEKMYSDTARDLANFVKDSVTGMKKYPRTVIIDESPEFFRNVKMAFREANIGTGVIYPTKDEDVERIKRISNVLYLDKLRILDTCTHTIQSIKDACFDEEKITKTGKLQLMDDYTNEGHGDALDCVSYGTKAYSSKLIA